MILKFNPKSNSKLMVILRTEYNFSSRMINKLISGNKITINGYLCGAYTKVGKNDTVEIVIEEKLPTYTNIDEDIDIIYEDDYIIIIDKPANLNMTPPKNNINDSLAGRIVRYYKNTQQKNGVHFINRLDRDTFGLVLIAKNAYIQNILQNNEIKKEYCAIVYGKPRSNFGTISQPIGRLSDDSILRTVDENGQYSISKFIVIDYYNEYSVLKLIPVTGRTNQLRVHCAWAGFPIVGDFQYGSKDSIYFSKNNNIFTQQLCSTRLEFNHPITNEYITFFSKQKFDFEI